MAIMRQFKPGQLQTGSLYPISASFALTASYAQNAGVIFETGSLVTTSSFNAFTSSYIQDSASFSSSISLLSGSFETTSGSFSTRIANLENFSSSLDATFATDAELNAATASLSASIANLSSSFEIFSGSYNTGSFSGSFIGDGNGLYNIPASGIVGLNLSQISSGSVSASISPNSGLQINTNVNAPSFTGSFTGSFIGDGSQLTGIVSSKWTGSNPISRDGNVEITGSLNVTNGITASLYGTASWAENSLTASYVLQAVSASYASNSLSASYALTASYVENAQTASYIAIEALPLIQPVSEYETIATTIASGTPRTLPNALTYVSSSTYEYIEVFANQQRLRYNIDFIPVSTSSIQFTFAIPSGSEMTYKVFRRP